MRAIISKTSQLEITHYEDMTATITQGKNTIKVDAKALTRDESLVIVEAVLRVLEISMLELRHIREVFIEPEMVHIPANFVPEVVHKLKGSRSNDKFALTYYVDGKPLVYTGNRDQVKDKERNVLNQGHKVAKVTLIKNNKIRGGN